MRTGLPAALLPDAAEYHTLFQKSAQSIIRLAPNAAYSESG
jgi:hypothetical protein